MLKIMMMKIHLRNTGGSDAWFWICLYGHFTCNRHPSGSVWCIIIIKKAMTFIGVISHICYLKVTFTAVG
jgi:hypothetical protein